MWEPATLLKKAPTQVFSCEICKLFKKNYFEEHLWMSASKLYLKRDYNTGVFLWTLLFKNTYFVVDLRMAGSETPIRGSLFNKVASVTAWKHLTVLERDPSKGIYLWILWNFKEAFFAEHLLPTTFHRCCFFLFVDQWVLQPPQFIWWSNGKLGEGIYKSFQCCVVMEIRPKLHYQLVATHIST